MSRPRNIKMLPITPQPCRRLGVPFERVICENVKGVFVDHLYKVFTAMINQSILPADAKISFLYYDSRFEAWAILIESILYENIPAGEMS